jgi:FMN hydrolase / 5-amino-6-(5-phospho-D-ribitylamino)uracil phosphatase
VRPALARLQCRYPLYALSNGNADLALCGIAHYFSGHLTARAAGVAKPNKRIFTDLAARAGVAPAEVLHVGDDPLMDVDGARRAGMQAVWLNRDGRDWPANLEMPTATIKSLAELS